MKTEHFDEEIRRKLERLNFPPSDADIERVHSYVKIHHSPSFWGKFGKTLTYSAAATVLTSSIIYNVIQHNENKSLLKNIEQQQLATKQEVVSPTESMAKIENKQVEHRVDTVYVTRYVQVPVRGNNEEKSYVKVQENADEIGTNKQEENTIDFQKKPKNQEVTGQGNLNKSTIINKNSDNSESTQSPKSMNNLLANDKNEEKMGAFKAQNSENGIKSSNSGINTERSFDNTISDSKLRNEKNPPVAYVPPAMEENRLIFPEKELKTKESVISTGNGFGDRYSMISVARQNYKATEKSKKSRGSFLSNIQLPSLAIDGVNYRAGILGEYTSFQGGAGISAEALIGKHFGFSTGIKSKINFNEKFFTDEHFQQDKHEDFRQKYAPKVPDDKEILDITLGTKIVSLPLQVNYYKNFGQKFLLFGGIGTDLDLKVSQNVQFDYRESPTNFQEVGAKNPLMVSTFNNLRYSIGAEVRLKHFAYQLSPVFVSHFRDVPYSKERNYLGGQFRILYQF